MLADKIRQAIFEAYRDCGYDVTTIKSPADIPLETPKKRQFGEYSTNIAMITTKSNCVPPLDIARKLIDVLPASGLFDSIEIAGPGFINFHVRASLLQDVVEEALTNAGSYGNSPAVGKKVQVEFVSANPTGPLSVGHGRIAAFGDALANVFAAAGYDVSREFYVNDVGNQIRNLASSVDLRYREFLGEDISEEEIGYQGEYIRDYAAELREKHGDALLQKSETERRAMMAEYTIERAMGQQAAALEKFGVKYDRWFRESELYKASLVEQTLESLKASGYTYESEDALWFASTKFCDEKDRVLRKASGIPTYFLSDIAYHKEKFDRGFDTVIDIWGADHHGYIDRMKSSVQALGYDPSRLEIIIIQFVRFKQSDEYVRMSKRAGNIITLTDLMEDIGTDVARFFFLMRTKESHLDFDLELAQDKSEANPMHYLQYAHARICTMIAKAAGLGMAPDCANLSLLTQPQELSLMKKIADFPWEIQSAADSREPHRIITFLTELAGEFHTFYHDIRVIDETEKNLSSARLALCSAVKTVFRNGLAIIGITAPEHM